MVKRRNCVEKVILQIAAAISSNLRESIFWDLPVHNMRSFSKKECKKISKRSLLQASKSSIAYTISLAHRSLTSLTYGKMFYFVANEKMTQLETKNEFSNKSKFGLLFRGWSRNQAKRMIILHNSNTRHDRQHISVQFMLEICLTANLMSRQLHSNNDL